MAYTLLCYLKNFILHGEFFVCDVWIGTSVLTVIVLQLTFDFVGYNMRDTANITKIKVSRNSIFKEPSLKHCFWCFNIVTKDAK
jgi:hypothetical protein